MILKLVVEENRGMTLKEAKKQFPAILNGTKHVPNGDFLQQYANEAAQARQLLMNIPEFAVIRAYSKAKFDNKRRAHAKKAKKNNDDSPFFENEEGTFMAHLYFHHEALALNTFYEFLHARDVKVFTAEFDGLKHGDVDEAMLREASAHVQSKTGLEGIEFEFKEMSVEPEFEAYLEAGRVGLKADARMIMIEHDEDGARTLLTGVDMLKGKIQGCNGTTYVRPEPGPWRRCSKEHHELLEMIMNKDLCIAKGEDELEHRSKSVIGARHLKTAVLAKVHGSMANPHFEQLMVNSTRGKLCYTDGVYDPMGGFTPWEACADTVHTLVTIGRDFVPREAVKQEDIDDVYETILLAPFRERLTADATEEECNRSEAKTRAIVKCLLETLARALYGHVEDKVWIQLLGLRNSGKGVLIEILKNAFGTQYVMGMESGNLLPKDHSGDCAKLNSFLMHIRWARFVYPNEAPVGTCDGNAIKKLASGGDTFQARQNYMDETEIAPTFTFALACNEQPKVNPADAYQNALIFQFQGAFKSEAEQKAEGHDNDGTTHPDAKRQRLSKVARADIKTVYCREPRIMDAFMWLVLDHYSSTKPVIDNDDAREELLYNKSESSDSVAEVLERLFEVDRTKSQNWKLTNAEMKKKSSFELQKGIWEVLEKGSTPITTEKMLRQHILDQYGKWVKTGRNMHGRWLANIRVKPAPDNAMYIEAGDGAIDGTGSSCFGRL